MGRKCPVQNTQKCAHKNSEHSFFVFILNKAMDMEMRGWNCSLNVLYVWVNWIAMEHAQGISLVILCSFEISRFTKLFSMFNVLFSIVLLLLLFAYLKFVFLNICMQSIFRMFSNNASECLKEFKNTIEKQQNLSTIKTLRRWFYMNIEQCTHIHIHKSLWNWESLKVT